MTHITSSYGNNMDKKTKTDTGNTGDGMGRVKSNNGWTQPDGADYDKFKLSVNIIHSFVSKSTG